MLYFYLCFAFFLSLFGTRIYQEPSILLDDYFFTGATVAGLLIFGVIICITHSRNRLLASVTRKRSLTHLSWNEYEALCADYLKKKGIKASLSRPGADGGIDIHAQWRGRKLIVQCKHWKKPVGVATVREMFGLMHDHQAASVIVFSSSRFSKPAWDFAKGKPIYLVDGRHLIREIGSLG